MNNLLVSQDKKLSYKDNSVLYADENKFEELRVCIPKKVSGQPMSRYLNGISLDVVYGSGSETVKLNFTPSTLHPDGYLSQNIQVKSEWLDGDSVQFTVVFEGSDDISGRTNTVSVKVHGNEGPPAPTDEFARKSYVDEAVGDIDLSGYAKLEDLADYLKKIIELTGLEDAVQIQREGNDLIVLGLTDYSVNALQGSITLDTEDYEHSYTPRAVIKSDGAVFSLRTENQDDAVIIQAGDYSSYIQINYIDRVDGQKKKSLQIGTGRIKFSVTDGNTTTQKQWTFPNAETGRLVVSTEVPNYTYSNSLPPRSYSASDQPKVGDIWCRGSGTSMRMFVCTQAYAYVAQWSEIALTPYTGT